MYTGGRTIEVLERAAGEPQRQAQQLIVQRPFFFEALDHAGAHLIERASGEFGVEEVRGLHELRCVDRFADVHGLLRHLVAAGDHTTRMRLPLSGTNSMR